MFGWSGRRMASENITAMYDRSAHPDKKKTPPKLCHPAQGINWLILYAAQQWNNYMNSLYKAVENAIEIVRGP